eukprot:CAMPEP_0197529342 /NCGR_PEP_ID=MMETSP1318-20131121/28087_1 /TAXON_ID=552666 /ORGANISM="Partenskyella glossopodia, Strain RCC365" /LENGTH=381 /DNA_ID=CAMNT_0043084769 /DNA_START=294 /DNA_END=1436 /DNA_ORIENTATION=-
MRSEDCMVAYKVYVTDKSAKNEITLAIKTMDVTLSEKLLMAKLDLIAHTISFMLGPTWMRVRHGLLQVALDGIKPMLARCLEEDSDSLEFCLGYPEFLPSEFKFQDAKKKILALKKAIENEIGSTLGTNSNQARFLDVGAAFYENKIFAATSLWPELIVPTDAFCIGNYLQQYPHDTKRELPCYLIPPKNILPEIKDYVYLEDRKRAKRLVCFQVVPKLRLVFVVPSGEHTLDQAFHMVQQTILTTKAIDQLRRTVKEAYSSIPHALGLNNNILCFVYISKESKRVLRYAPKPKGIAEGSRSVDQTIVSLRHFANISGPEFFFQKHGEKVKCLDFGMKSGDMIMYAAADFTGCLFLALPVTIPLGSEGQIARALLKRINSL